MLIDLLQNGAENLHWECIKPAYVKSFKLHPSIFKCIENDMLLDATEIDKYQTLRHEKKLKLLKIFPNKKKLKILVKDLEKHFFALEIILEKTGDLMHIFKPPQSHLPSFITNQYNNGSNSFLNGLGYIKHQRHVGKGRSHFKYKDSNLEEKYAHNTVVFNQSSFINPQGNFRILNGAINSKQILSYDTHSTNSVVFDYFELTKHGPLFGFITAAFTRGDEDKDVDIHINSFLRKAEEMWGQENRKPSLALSSYKLHEFYESVPTLIIIAVNFQKK